MVSIGAGLETLAIVSGSGRPKGLQEAPLPNSGSNTIHCAKPVQATGSRSRWVAPSLQMSRKVYGSRALKKFPGGIYLCSFARLHLPSFSDSCRPDDSQISDSRRPSFYSESQLTREMVASNRYITGADGSTHSSTNYSRNASDTMYAREVRAANRVISAVVRRRPVSPCLQS